LDSQHLGVKIIIEWPKNEEGVRTKVTKTVRVKKQVKKLNPAAIRRRSLKKFGDALGQNASDNLTVVSTEEIFLERTRPAGAKAEPEKGADLASLGNASLIVCRTCGKKGDHWTSKCPFKELAATKGFAVGGEKPPTDDDMGVPGMSAGPGGKGSYVPPSMRSGGKPDGGESMRRGRDDNSIRVTNLSEDTREQDLQELFRPFGAISRIYVPLHRYSQSGTLGHTIYLWLVAKCIHKHTVMMDVTIISCKLLASGNCFGFILRGFTRKDMLSNILCMRNEQL
jgi:translation initiation factor 3 subunit G